MSGTKFFQTVMGKHFYEGAVPRIARALERIADALEEQNNQANAEPTPYTSTPEGRLALGQSEEHGGG